MADPDPLAEIKARRADLPSDPHWSDDDIDWLVGEIERLRKLVGEASAREVLGLPND
jgi:hypothetical protein